MSRSRLAAAMRALREKVNPPEPGMVAVWELPRLVLPGTPVVPRLRFRRPGEPRLDIPDRDARGDDRE